MSREILQKELDRIQDAIISLRNGVDIFHVGTVSKDTLIKIIEQIGYIFKSYDKYIKTEQIETPSYITDIGFSRKDYKLEI